MTSEKVYVVTKDGELVSMALSEAAAWDTAAMNACVVTWWGIRWGDDDCRQKRDIRARGYDVKPATVTIDDGKPVKPRKKKT